MKSIVSLVLIMILVGRPHAFYAHDIHARLNTIEMTSKEMDRILETEVTLIGEEGFQHSADHFDVEEL